MGKKSQAKKTPKFAPENQPTGARQPKIGVTVEGFTNPVWRLAHIDWDGPWCPSKCAEAGVREILKRLANFESMSWTEIQSGSKSHLVGAAGIIKEARQRLSELKKEEWADHLFSLRMSNKERLWGFLRAGVFHALWWDPEHQVYPSPKKHT